MSIKLTKDDITTMDVDAIVNAASESLLGGGKGERESLINAKSLSAVNITAFKSDAVAISLEILEIGIALKAHSCRLCKSVKREKRTFPQVFI